MPALKTLWFFAVVSLLAISCSPISGRLQQQALKVDLEPLMAETGRYQGEMVLLGGYVIETRVFPAETRLVVLQAPLSFTDRPKSKDRSQGRFIVVHAGYLDPQVYAKDRVVTVAGTVLGKTTEKVDACPQACLILQSREIHLWPEERSYPPYYGPSYWGPGYDPFWNYPFYRRPFGYPYHPYGPRYHPYWW
jgi:outer membrane lipoprotein